MEEISPHRRCRGGTRMGRKGGREWAASVKFLTEIDGVADLKVLNDTIS